MPQQQLDTQGPAAAAALMSSNPPADLSVSTGIGGGGGVPTQQRESASTRKQHPRQGQAPDVLPPLPPPWHHPATAPPPEGSRVVEKLLVQSYVIMQKLTELEASATRAGALLQEVRRRASEAGNCHPSSSFYQPRYVATSQRTVRDVALRACVCLAYPAALSVR